MFTTYNHNGKKLGEFATEERAYLEGKTYASETGNSYSVTRSEPSAPQYPICLVGNNATVQDEKLPLYMCVWNKRSLPNKILEIHTANSLVGKYGHTNLFDQSFLNLGEHALRDDDTEEGLRALGDHILVPRYSRSADGDVHFVLLAPNDEWSGDNFEMTRIN